jgi:hypothetical protein
MKEMNKNDQWSHVSLMIAKNHSTLKPVLHSQEFELSINHKKFHWNCTSGITGVKYGQISKLKSWKGQNSPKNQWTEKCWWHEHLDMELIIPLKFWWNFTSSFWGVVQTNCYVADNTKKTFLFKGNNSAKNHSSEKLVNDAQVLDLQINPVKKFNEIA